MPSCPPLDWDRNNGARDESTSGHRRRICATMPRGNCRTGSRGSISGGAELEEGDLTVSVRYRCKGLGKDSIFVLVLPQLRIFFAVWFIQKQNGFFFLEVENKNEKKN